MNLRNKELNLLDETRIRNYIMRILHQFKLMTSSGFDILLILVESIKIDIAQTWEGLQLTTGRIKKQRMTRTVEQTTIRIKNEPIEDKENTGKN